MRSTLLLVPVLLAGCTPASAPAFQDTFAQEVAGRSVGKAQSCISPFGNQNLRIVNRQMLAYGHGTTIHVNRLRAPCPSLRPASTIIIEANGGQYCSGDHVRALDFGSTIPGPVCLLGEWTSYTKP